MTRSIPSAPASSPHSARHPTPAVPSSPPPDEPPAAAPAAAGSVHGRRGMVGIGLAALCAIHCIATPAVIALPFGSFLAAEALEWLLLAAAVGLGAAITGADYRYHHGHYAPLAIVAGAATLLVAGHALEGTAARIPAIVAGALALTAAHVVNLRLRRRPHPAGRGCPSGATSQ